MRIGVTQADAPRRRAGRGGGQEETEDPASLGKDTFARRLKKFHSDCLRPPYPSLVRISGELRQLYPDFQGDLPQLSRAAMSEILNGKRKHPPAPGWVASFVLSCQQWAYRMHTTNKDPGLSSLPAWYAALRAAHSPLAVPAGERARGSVSPGQLTLLCPPSTVQLTPSQRKLVASYGPHVRELLGQVQADLPEAGYRATLLLATDPAHAVQAQPLLLQAAAAYHTAPLA